MEKRVVETGKDFSEERERDKSRGVQGKILQKVVQHILFFDLPRRDQKYIDSQSELLIQVTQAAFVCK